MIHYSTVILVLSSNNDIVYKNCKKVWQKYYKINPAIKVYFVYGAISEELENYDSLSDIICNDVDESNMISKTIRAMGIIDNTITYDFFIRTNLSTFWDFTNLPYELSQLPRSGCYSGHGPQFYPITQTLFLSGIDTILTKDMVKSFIQNRHLIDYSMPEDVAMGKYFNYTLQKNMIPTKLCYFIDDVMDIETIDRRISESIHEKISHYRVKNSKNRNETDLLIYKRMLLQIYNVEY